MTNIQTINKDPFDHLDSYQEAAFLWAETVWDKIRQQFDCDKLDSELLSIAFADIFNDLLHISMNYADVDFEYYLINKYGKALANQKNELVSEYRRKISDEIFIQYGGFDGVVDSLVGSVAIKDEDGIFHNPLSTEQMLEVMSFINNKLNY
jgi:hypothetical protein